MSMNELGKPVPFDRQQAAYDLLREWGVKEEDAHGVIQGMADCIKRDKPFEAQEVALKHADLTGAYRLLATLLTPVVRTR